MAQGVTAITRPHITESQLGHLLTDPYAAGETRVTHKASVLRRVTCQGVIGQ